jgi:prephenate dehydratase
MKKIVYQGEPGCYSEIAAKKIMGKDIEIIGVKSFEKVINSVINSKDTLGILPVENTLIGKISQNFDLLIKYQVKVIGEIKIRISFNLMTLMETIPEQIEEVWSHPAALEQCKNFLFEKGYKPVAIYDTAGGAKLLKEKGRRNTAILADQSVAKTYGLKTIDKHIEDNDKNYTRFFIISNKKKRLNIGNKTKTSIVFGVKNVPGILFKCLSVFALRNINLCSIESRPIHGKPWEYLFFIDFEGDIKDERCEKAIKGLKDIVGFLRVLGTYNSMEG